MPADDDDDDKEGGWSPVDVAVPDVNAAWDVADVWRSGGLNPAALACRCWRSIRERDGEQPIGREALPGELLSETLVLLQLLDEWSSSGSHRLTGSGGELCLTASKPTSASSQSTQCTLHHNLTLYKLSVTL